MTALLPSATATIAAFNIQTLGSTKMSKPDIVDVICKIMIPYSICMVQEIRDSSQTVPWALLNELNRYDGRDDFNLTLSERLGTTRYKEQYGIYYRKSVWDLNQTYTYPDVNATFEREPFGAVFTSPWFAHTCLGVIVIHAKPDVAETEIDALADVYEDFKLNTSCENVLIMGDFNADCSYVTRSEWRNMSLLKDERFVWLLNDSVDTTVKTTDCAYDRIIAAGDSDFLDDLIDPKVFRFDEELSLGDVEPSRVSDHYPVDVTIKVLPPAIVITDDITIEYQIDLSSVNDIIANMTNTTLAKWSMSSQNCSGMTQLHGAQVANVLLLIDDLETDMPGLFPSLQMRYVRAALHSDVWSSCSLPDGEQMTRCATASKEVTIDFFLPLVRFSAKVRLAGN